MYCSAETNSVSTFRDFLGAYLLVRFVSGNGFAEVGRHVVEERRHVLGSQDERLRIPEMADFWLLVIHRLVHLLSVWVMCSKATLIFLEPEPAMCAGFPCRGQTAQFRKTRDFLTTIR